MLCVSIASPCACRWVLPSCFVLPDAAWRNPAGTVGGVIIRVSPASPCAWGCRWVLPSQPRRNGGIHSSLVLPDGAWRRPAGTGGRVMLCVSIASPCAWGCRWVTHLEPGHGASNNVQTHAVGVGKQKGRG
jgi:hypothetical protein